MTGKVIKIDDSKKCTYCGKGGAIESSGVCLACTAKILTGKQTITIAMIEKAIDRLQKHLHDHHAEIDKAYNNLEEDETGNKAEALAVGLKVKFQQLGKKIAMQTEIAFSTGKVKDGDKVIFDDKQPRIGEGF